MKSDDVPEQNSSTLNLIGELCCPQRAMAVLSEWGADYEADIQSMHHAARECESAVADCVYFPLLREAHITKFFDRGVKSGRLTFWKDVSTLLIFISRSSPTAIHQLIRGILWAVAEENTIGLALHLRAFLEQASSMAYLGDTLAKSRERLQNEVWPVLPDISHAEPTATDEALRATLVQYAMGRRVQRVSGNDWRIPTSRKDWDRLRKSMQVQGDSEVRARQFMNDIDHVAARDGLESWRIAYELLCEYCHPNSASRTSQFVEWLAVEGSDHFAVGQTASRGAGIEKVETLLQATLRPACQLTEGFFRVLSECRRPMPSLDQRDPRRGTWQCWDEFGRSSYVKLSDIKSGYLYEPQRLTDAQRARIEKVREQVRDVYSPPAKGQLDDWFRDFEHEENPESEIRIWEAMVTVFQRETQERTNCRREQRRLLFHAIMLSTSVASVNDLLSCEPRLKALVKLGRVFDRTKAEVSQRL